MGNPIKNNEGEDQSYGYIGAAVTSTLTFASELEFGAGGHPVVKSAIVAVDLLAGVSTQASDGDLGFRDLSEVAGSLAVGGISGAAVGAAFTGPFAPVGAIVGFAAGVAGGFVGEYLGGAAYDQLTSGNIPPAKVYRVLPDGRIEKQVTQIIGQDGSVGDRSAILHTTIITYNADGSREGAEQSVTTVYDPKESIQLIQATSQANNLVDALEIAAKQTTEPTSEDPTTSPPTTPPTTTNDDDHDAPVVTIGSGSSGPAGGPVPAEDDPTPTGSVGPAGGPIPPSPPHTPPYLDPDVSGPQPVLLDLDGDGIEVVFGEDIYFDTDGDGFVEKTAWAAADDGFLVIDLNADGTRGAGDGVIDLGAEIAFAAGPPEGDLGLRVAV